MPRKNGKMTAQERMIARAAAATGEDVSVIAERAGVPLSSAYQTLRRPAVRNLINQQRLATLGEAALAGSKFLLHLISDTKAQTGHRVRATEIALKYVAKADDDNEGRPLHELTLEQLNGMIERFGQELADRAKPVIDQDPGDVFG